jgi:membrane protease YdiL (CAAX protease family)
MTFLKSVFWNSPQRRLRTLWRLIGQAVLFAVLMVLLYLPLAFVSGRLPISSGYINVDVESTLFSIYALVDVLLATLLSLWLAGILLDHRRFADFGFRVNKDWWLDLGFGLALGALLMAGIFAVEWAAGWITIRGTLWTAQPDQAFLPALIVPAVMFLCVGIYEEALSRGYLLHNLSEGLNLPVIGPKTATILAWLLSSLLFSLAHLGNPHASIASVANLVLAGIFLGLGYVLTGQLAIPIGIHITWNFFQGNVFGFPVSGLGVNNATFVAISQSGPDLWTGGAFGPEAGLIGIAAILIGCALTLLWVRKRHGRAGIEASLAQAPSSSRA